MNTKENMPKTEQSADTKKERDYGSKENPASIDEKIIVDFDYYQSDNSSKLLTLKLKLISQIILLEKKLITNY